jgi:hypothetical protein
MGHFQKPTELFVIAATNTDAAMPPMTPMTFRRLLSLLISFPRGPSALMAWHPAGMPFGGGDFGGFRRLNPANSPKKTYLILDLTVIQQGLLRV